MLASPPNIPAYGCDAEWPLLASELRVLRESSMRILRLLCFQAEGINSVTDEGAYFPG
jgi:hypothetical protein